MFPLLFCGLICIILIENTSGGNGIVPYYGVPIGPLFNAARNVRGDVYVSDKNTITVAHFGHRGQPGCTAFVVGPSKSQLKGEKGQYNGLFLAYRKHVQDNSEERRARRSSDRDAGLVPRIAALNPNLHPFDWPFDFGRPKADDPIRDNDDKSPIKGQFKVELEKNENTKSPITSPVETTVSVGATSGISTEKPVTRIRTVDLEQKPVTEKSKPEIALSLDNKAAKNDAASPADGFVEELTLDDLKGTGAARFTLPNNATTTPLTSAAVSETFSAAISQSSPDQTPTSPPSEIPTAPNSSPLSSDSILLTSLDLESSSSTGAFASQTQNVTTSDNQPSKPWASTIGGGVDGSPITELSFESSFSASLKGDDETPSPSPSLLPSPSLSPSLSPSPTESSPIAEATNATVFGVSESLVSVEANETIAGSAEVTGANSGENSSESEETTTAASKPARPANRTFAQRKTTTTPPESKRPKLRHNVPKPAKIDEDLPVESSVDEQEQEHEQRRPKQKKPKVDEEEQQPHRSSIVEKKAPRKEVIEQEKLYQIITDRVPKKSQLRKQQLERSENEENSERYGNSRHIDSDSRSNQASRNNPEPRFRGEPPTRPAGGIIWSDYTLSPNARRRIDDIRNSEYRYGGANENAPAARRPSEVDVLQSSSKQRKAPSTVEEDNDDGGKGSPLDAGAPGGPAPPGSRFDYKAERYESLRRAGRLDNFYEAPPTVFAPTSAGDDYKSNLLSALHHAERSSNTNNDDQQSAGAAESNAGPATGSRPKSAVKKSTVGAQEDDADVQTEAPPTTIDYRAERYDALKKAGLLDDRTPRPTKTTPKPSEPPLLKGAWYVDERAPNRRLGSKRHRRAMAEPAGVASKNEMNLEAAIDSNKQILYKVDPNFNVKTTNEKMINFDSQDELVTITLDGRFNLNEFQYFGLYDTCQREMLSTVTLNDVDYPSIAEISGFRPLKRRNNVHSEKIFILNCNTLYVVNFTFNAAEKTDAFFYVGSGEFPANVVKKEKAHVLGYPESTPLRNYANENLYVKLPSTTKTFDINWLAVFDEDKGEFLANTVIPPVIVPPCDY